MTIRQFDNSTILRVLVATLMMLPVLTWGQAPKGIPFVRPSTQDDTGVNSVHTRLKGNVQLDHYADADSTKLFGVDADGNLVLRAAPAGSGTVTSITFTAPLTGGTVTSAGTVSIPAATGSTDGYLKKEDWALFSSWQEQLADSAAAIREAIPDTSHFVRVADSLYGTPFAYMPYYQAYSRFVPYVGAMNGLNLNNYPITTREANVDTIYARTTGVGIHLHQRLGSLGIASFGRGGGTSIEFDGYRTTVPGDSVLTTNDTGLIIQYDLKGKLANYTLRDELEDTAAAHMALINGKQPTGNYITALTGDVTATGPGSAAATLANSGVTAGTYGSSTVIPTYTVDSKGRITGVTTVAAAVTASNTVTLTNKRWMQRTASITSNANPTYNTDNIDILNITAQSGAISSMSTNATGTPADGDVFEVRITGASGSVGITWGANFANGSVTAPTTTTGTATLTVKWEYYTTSSYGNNKWICKSYD